MKEYVCKVSAIIRCKNKEQAEKLSKNLLIEEISSGMIYINELKSID